MNKILLKVLANPLKMSELVKYTLALQAGDILAIEAQREVVLNSKNAKIMGELMELIDEQVRTEFAMKLKPEVYEWLLIRKYQQQLNDRMDVLVKVWGVPLGIAIELGVPNHIKITLIERTDQNDTEQNPTASGA